MLNIYTDGSCWPNPSANGGWSFVVYDQGREVAAVSGKADAFTSNNRMEMTGMLRALMWLGDRPGTVHTDSQLVVYGLNSWARKWMRNGWMRKDKATKQMVPVLNADLWEVMMVARMPQHRVVWVKGHAGILGNVRADALAEAARMGVAA